MSRAETGSAETETEVQMLWEQGERLQNGAAAPWQMMYEMQTICCGEPFMHRSLAGSLVSPSGAVCCGSTPQPHRSGIPHQISDCGKGHSPLLPLASSQEKVLHTVGAQPMQQTSSFLPKSEPHPLKSEQSRGGQGWE